MSRRCMPDRAAPSRSPSSNEVNSCTPRRARPRRRTVRATPGRVPGTPVIPVELVPTTAGSRRCGIIPPPRRHLVRYAGCSSRRSGKPSARDAPRAVTRPRRRTGARRKDTAWPARDGRIPWAELLHRVFATDVLSCPRSGRHIGCRDRRGLRGYPRGARLLPSAWAGRAGAYQASSNESSVCGRARAGAKVTACTAARSPRVCAEIAQCRPAYTGSSGWVHRLAGPISGCPLVDPGHLTRYIEGHVQRFTAIQYHCRTSCRAQ